VEAGAAQGVNQTSPERPDDHAELRKLIADLGRDLVSEMPGPPPTLV